VSKHGYVQVLRDYPILIVVIVILATILFSYFIFNLYDIVRAVGAHG
jgi:hypothetical protein